MSESPNPHNERARQLLKAHPEIRKLFGHDTRSAIWSALLVFTQLGIAYALRDSSIWLNLLIAYVVGAVINHALFVMFHEATHNLVFKTTFANRLFGVIINMPIVFPSAMGFRTYHLIHHREQGVIGRDADLPGPQESAWVGTSRVRKSLWFLFFFVVEGIIRPTYIRGVKLFDGWVLLNAVFEFAFLALFTWAFGWNALLYLCFATMFSIGLHPVGARWIQEHYVFKEGQETYSYYGPLNKLCFNVGYHNEHHDAMNVSWSKLPLVRKMAPEFYDNLYYHTSWSGLLWRFIMDTKMTLFHRYIRAPEAKTIPANTEAFHLAPTMAMPVAGTRQMGAAPLISQTR